MSKTALPKRFYSPLMTALVRNGQFAKLPNPAVRVLIVLDSHCNDSWECFLTYETLRMESGIGSDSTVLYGLQKLASLGVIEWTGGKGKTSNRYRLTPSREDDSCSTEFVEQREGSSTKTVGQQGACSTVSRRKSPIVLHPCVDKQEKENKSINKR